MSSSKGCIVLMGSGELTATMVEVHKELLARFGSSPHAVFLDTPAGFQLNADQLSQKAVEYFQSRVLQPLSIVSFKAHDPEQAAILEQACRELRSADYILIGPGSPTYAVRQWLQTTIPTLFKQRIETGGCLVAASAAALTVGRCTLPVYEIYKVGEPLHWVDGIDVLGHFGFPLVVVPHWNNAEGGNHDTRFCYMGEPRFKELQALLPEDASVLGLDEHTACILDFEKDSARIAGIGSVTLQTKNSSLRFGKGDTIPLDVLRGRQPHAGHRPDENAAAQSRQEPEHEKNTIWDAIHLLRKTFETSLAEHRPEKASRALLDLDTLVWKARQEGEHEELVTQAREVMRDTLALLGARLAELPESTSACVAPVVEELLKLRKHFRERKQWAEADAIRNCLAKACILVEDTPDGAQWHLQ